MSEQAEIPPNKLVAFGVIGGLIGIYLNAVPMMTGMGQPAAAYFSVFGALGAICAVIWGAEAVRRVAKYGLGTGVPSIGQIAMGMGIVASMFGLAIVSKTIPLAGPIVALVTASIIGLVIGLLAQHVIKMKIPVMIRCMTEIAASGALIIVGFSASIAGDITFSAILDTAFKYGFILAIFWVGAVAMLHPFNACLGPDEKQKRLLYLAGSTGASTMAVVGIAALITIGSAAVLTIIIGIILWLVFYKKFWDEVYKDAASVVETGLIPATEG